MFSKFFIDRPIFASVLSIVITLAGGIAVLSLPIAQYPDITPPTVEVAAYYPGANAQVVADTVAAGPSAGDGSASPGRDRDRTTQPWQDPGTGCPCGACDTPDLGGRWEARCHPAPNVQ